MSAPTHAEPLGKFGDEPLPKFKCENCGYIGRGEKLLSVDPDEDTNLWCPKCRMMNWHWL